MIVGEVIFTSLLAVLVAKERLSRSQALGIGLGAVGIVVLVLGEAGRPTGRAASPACWATCWCSPTSGCRPPTRRGGRSAAGTGS